MPTTDSIALLNLPPAWEEELRDDLRKPGLKIFAGTAASGLGSIALRAFLDTHALKEGRLMALVQPRQVTSPMKHVRVSVVGTPRGGSTATFVQDAIRLSPRGAYVGDVDSGETLDALNTLAMVANTSAFVTLHSEPNAQSALEEIERLAGRGAWFEHATIIAVSMAKTPSGFRPVCEILLGAGPMLTRRLSEAAGGRAFCGVLRRQRPGLLLHGATHARRLIGLGLLSPRAATAFASVRTTARLARDPATPIKALRGFAAPCELRHVIYTPSLVAEIRHTLELGWSIEDVAGILTLSGFACSQSSICAALGIRAAGERTIARVGGKAPAKRKPVERARS